MNFKKKVMKFVQYVNMKMQVYHCSSPHYMFTISETELVLDNTIFPLVCSTGLDSLASIAM